MKEEGDMKESIELCGARSVWPMTKKHKKNQSRPLINCNQWLD